MRRQRKLMYIAFIIVCIGSLFLYSGTGLSSSEQTAVNRSITFVAEEHLINIEELQLETVQYWEDEDRFAVSIHHTKENKNYQIALRLNEDKDDTAFILDVTGQFDDFGMAFCH